MAISVGSVSVDVVPDLTRFVPELRGKLRDLPTLDLPVRAVTEAANAEIDRVAKVARTATVDVAVNTRAAAAEIDKVAETPRTATVNVKVDDSKAKQDLDALQKEIRDRTLQLNVSTSDAKARLAALANDIAKTKAAVKVNADDADAKAKLAALKKEASELRGKIELDSAPARAQIAKLKADADKAKVTVQAEADTAKAAAQLAKLTKQQTVNVRVDDKGSILSTTNRLGALLTAGVALGPTIVPAAAAATAAIGAMGIGAAAAGAGIGTLVLGFSGVSEAVEAMGKAQATAGVSAAQHATALANEQKALAGLGPAGAEFARFLFSLRGHFDALKSTAQAGLLPGVQQGIQALLPLMPTLNRTVGIAARAMGDLAEQAGKALTAPFWREFFTMIQNTVGPNLTTFGQIIGNLATGFAGLLMAFQPVSEQLGGGLLALSKRFAEFGAGASKNAGFQAFLNYIQNVGPIVIGTIRSIAKTIGRIIVALAPIGPVVLQSIGFLADVINRIPTDVLRVVLVTIGALVIGFRIWAAAVWLLNVAMNANPISLIVIGLAALGAGLYLAYTRSETFRNIVDKAWAVVKAGAIAMWGILKPILVAIGDFIMTKVVPAVMWLWNKAIVPAFNGIRSAIWWAWNKVILPIFDAIKWYINTVVGPVFTWLWKEVISPAWTGIQILIGAAWKVIELILAALELYIRAVVGPVFSWLWDKAVKPAMKAIGDGIEWAWDNVIKPVLETLGDFISKHVAPAFETGVKAIGKAWDKVKDIAKVPIKFVVNTVLNEGLIAAFNKINASVGSPVKKIEPFTLPKGFARGTEDHRAQIAHPNQPRLWAEPETGGEAYIPLAPSKRQRSARILDDVARRFGYGLIKMANGGTLLTAGRHLRDLGYNVAEGPGEFGPVHRVHAPNSRHYDGMALDINHGAGTSKAEQAALSRIVPYLQGLGLRVLFMVPNHYNHLHTDVPRGKGALSQIGGMVKGAAGAVADFLDPSKLITGPLQGLLNRIPGRDSVLGKIVAGVPKVLAKALVDKATGFVGAIAGTTGDLKDTPGTGGYGGAARWAQTVMVVLRQLGQPTSAVGAVLRRIQFESGGNPKAINNWDINAKRGHPSQGLMQTIPSTFNAFSGPYMARGIYDPLANIYAGVNYALRTYGSLAAIDPKNRPRGYDAGGYLQPGLTTVYNGTGKPEPVFTAEQFAAMRANGGSRGGLVINGDVHTASVEDFMREAASRQRLDAALHPIFA